MSKTNGILIASTFAVIALIFIQVQWMNQSRALIEEQFNNKVRMALCTAVESMTDDADVYMRPSCGTIEGLTGNVDEEQLSRNFEKTLSFYDIDLPYEINVTKDIFAKPATYSCAVAPFMETTAEAKIINVTFPNKKEYVMRKMGFMLFASILILVFIVTVLLLSNYMMLRQKRISEMNIDFFNNMAHEFRTPLASTKLALKLLSKKNPSETNNKYYDIIQRENLKLMEQVERVLHLAKMEGNEYQLEKEPVALDLILQKAIQDMEMHIKAKEAIVTVNAEEGDWTVIGDKFHLSHAFRNLLDNALKYSITQPIINITLKKSNGGFLVQFEDNGIGISKSNQKMIFKKFQRIQNGKRHDYKGFGLGLAYVKMIIERHRGAVNIVSELKTGSRFNLFLPVE